MTRWSTLRSSPQLAFFQRALVTDWLVIVALNVVSGSVEARYPYARDVQHQLGDAGISWPHVARERVPVWLLFRLAFWLPLALVVGLALVRRSRSVHDLHHALLAFLTSQALMRITVEGIKNRVGRLRPDFLARCAWDPVAEACTGPFATVKDGRRSFPSGHSATAFQGLLFVALYMAGKNGAFALSTRLPRSSFLQSRLLRLSLSLSPLCLAMWIAITRLEDHRHHVEDVVAGSTIGVVTALIGYLVYYPSPFRGPLWSMGTPKLVYGEEDDGIRLQGEEGFLPEAQDPSVIPPRPIAPPHPGGGAVPSAAPGPLAPGISNDALYTLLRRWNASIDHLKVATVHPGRLDLSPSPEGITFSPEKLQNNVERFYLSVIRNLIAFSHEVVALRSWDDPLRTGSFCSTYFIAWSSRFGVGPLVCATLALLVLHPPARAILFPPRPRSHSKSTPILGVESVNPIHPEGLTTGEREELEARAFAEALSDIAGGPFDPDGRNSPSAKGCIREAVATGGHGERSEAGVDEGQPASPANLASVDPAEPTKPTKRKAKVLARHGLPIQLVAGQLADAWERWANVLEPTSPPFEPHQPRVKVALHIFAVGVILIVVPAEFLIYATTFLLGFLFFGEPILKRIPPAVDAMMTNVDWRGALQIRNSLLNGVPSNTQLTIRLLREAELARTPLPPPPPLYTPRPKRPSTSRKPTNSSLTPSSDTTSLVDLDVESFDDDEVNLAGGSTTTKQSGKAKFGAFIKATAKLTETTAGYTSGQKKVNWQKISRNAVDKLKASTHSEFPERFMRIVPAAPADDDPQSTFYAHRNSAPGHLLIHPPSVSTDFAWTLEFLRVGKFPPMDASQASITIVMTLVTELKRTGGLGWKGRLAAGWMTDSMGSVGNGIDVSWGEGDTAGKVKFSGIVRRDELFNRLAGIAPHNLCHL